MGKCVASTLVSLLLVWNPGHVVSDDQLPELDADECFASMPVDSSVMRRIDGKSLKKDSPLDIGSLRYLKLLHVNAEGRSQMGEMVCHEAIAEDLIYIFRNLYEAGYRIERMVLVDDYDADDDASMAADNTSCFNTRFVAGTRKLSRHGMGMAVDINPLYNPYVKTLDGKLRVWPESGRKYAFDRDYRTDIPFKINHDDLCYKLFIERGFVWGGDWKSMKDYQHFEK